MVSSLDIKVALFLGGEEMLEKKGNHPRDRFLFQSNITLTEKDTARESLCQKKINKTLKKSNFFNMSII